MEQKIKKLFHLAVYKPKHDLSDNIWHFIVIRENRIIRLKLWAFSFVGCASLVSLVPAFKLVLNDFAESGFYEYLSLGFSSGGSILSFWQDFVLLLAESLPVMSIIVSLSLVFISFFSLWYAMKEIMRSQLSPSF
ncbi:MAG: hypothetical protein PHS95_02625 [Candidatus Pacebacteria bacterium]|nr:hypothetical protein [Candidatus Paceibacterota bacterium]